MAHARTSDDIDPQLIDGLDLPALQDYLARERPGLVRGDLTASLLAGGHSNLTYALRDDATTWVLRRPPLGRRQAAAHDMARECTAMKALAGTSVPVPAIVHLCEDTEVLGAPFYLSEHVEGKVYRTREDTEALTPERARQLSERLIDTLADLHRIEPDDVGLGQFGRPVGFLQRQLNRWTGEAERILGDQPGIDRLIARLRSEAPATSRNALVHGDFRLDNVMVGQDDKVAAVLDWEMATLGDPLSDLGLFWCYWEGVDNPGGDTMRKGIDPALGFPSMDHLVGRYVARVGHDVEQAHWYVALGYLKLAVLRRTIHQRYLDGHAPESFARVGELVPPLVKASMSALETS